MLHITDAQKAALDRDRRDKLIKRIDDWLLQEDRAWPRAAPEQRVKIIDSLLTYGEQSKLSAEADYALFCRGAIMLRADWQAFVEAPAQKALLLDEKMKSRAKVRAFYARAESVSGQMHAQGGQR